MLQIISEPSVFIGVQKPEKHWEEEAKRSEQSRFDVIFSSDKKNLKICREKHLPKVWVKTHTNVKAGACILAQAQHFATYEPPIT